MTGPGWSAYRSDSCEVPVPPGWTAFDGAQFEFEAVVIAPTSDRGFDPSVVVGTIDLDAPADPDAWLDTSDSLLGEELTEFQVIRRGQELVDGHDAIRRLGRYHDPHVGPIMLEQWVVATGNRALVLTASAAEAEYEATAPVFAEMAAGLRLAYEDRTAV
jgi:Probable lipoprotein LpqN